MSETDYEMVCVTTNDPVNRFYLGITNVDNYEKRAQRKLAELKLGSVVISENQDDLNKIIGDYIHLFANNGRAEEIHEVDFNMPHHMIENHISLFRSKHKRPIFSDTSIPLEKIVSVNMIERSR